MLSREWGLQKLPLQIVESNCYDDNTGSISAAVTNSVGVLTYEWFNGATSLGAAGPTSSISSLTPGTYTVEVFDPGTGCFAYGTGIINSPDTLYLVALLWLMLLVEEVVMERLML